MHRTIRLTTFCHVLPCYSQRTGISGFHMIGYFIKIRCSKFNLPTANLWY